MGISAIPVNCDTAAFFLAFFSAAAKCIGMEVTSWFIVSDFWLKWTEDAGIEKFLFYFITHPTIP